MLMTLTPLEAEAKLCQCTTWNIKLQVHISHTIHKLFSFFPPSIIILDAIIIRRNQP